MPKSLIIEIFGNAAQFGAELDKAAGKTRAFGKVAGVAGLAIAGGLAFGLEQSVKAAADAQTSTARMDDAFRTAHVSATAFASGIAAAEAANRKLGFSNLDTRESLGSLVVATHSGTKALEDMGVATDIARFKHIGLTDASKMLTMAMAGSQRAAHQLGIIVQPVTTNLDALKASHVSLTGASGHLLEAHAKLLDKMATGDAVIAQVTAKLHGQAQAYADTAAGGMAQFHAQLGNLEEKLGAGLLPAITKVVDALASFAAFMSQHTELAKLAVVGLAALATTLIAVSVASSLVAAAEGVAAAATGVWTGAQWLLNAALDANPIGLVVIAIAALTAGIVLAYEHSATFRAIVSSAFDAVKTAADAVLNFFRNNWPLIVGLIAGPFLPLVVLATNMFGIRSAITDAFEAILNWTKANWPIIATVISGPFAPLVALATNAFGVRSALENAFAAVIAAIRGRVDDAISAATAVGHGILSGVENGTAGLVSAVETKAAAVLALISGLPARILAALGDVSGLLYNAGVSIIQGLLDGLTSKLHEVENLASSIAGKIASLKGPIEADRQLLVPHGQAIIAGLQAGMESGLSGLLGSVSGYAPAIGGAAGAGTARPAGGGGGVGGLTVNLTVNGWVGNDQALAIRTRDELLRMARSNPNIFAGKA